MLDSSWEVLNLDKYSVKEQRPARYGIQDSIIEIVGFSCPRCGNRNTSIAHGDSAVCEKCSLQMMVYGNALYVKG